MSGLMQRPFVALGLLAMGMAVIPLNDAFIQLMSDRLPLAEIVFVRGVLALLIMAVFSRGISSMLNFPGAISGSSSTRVPCHRDGAYFIPLAACPADRDLDLLRLAASDHPVFCAVTGERIGIHGSCRSAWALPGCC